MSVSTSTGVSISSAEGRSLYAANAASQTVAATPDYHLPMTGPEVEEALLKARDLDPNSVGGVTVLPSDSTSPVDANTITDPGYYRVNNLDNIPSELEGVAPLYLSVFEKDGVLYQVLEAMGDRWTRYSTDGGNTWSAWSAKPISSGGIDTSGDPEEPAPDPVEAMQTDISALDSAINGPDGVLAKLSALSDSALGLGTTEAAAAMLAGTFDYDTDSALPTT